MSRHSDKHAPRDFPEAQGAFKVLMIHWVLQVARRIAFRCVIPPPIFFLSHMATTYIPIVSVGGKNRIIYIKLVHDDLPRQHPLLELP